MARRTFVELLNKSAIPSTANACVFASHYLLALGNRFSKELTFELQGGGLEPGCGILTGIGQMAAHMWVRAFDASQSWILDITADQFGYNPAIAVNEQACQGIYVPDSPASLAQSLQNAWDTEPILAELAKTTNA